MREASNIDKTIKYDFVCIDIEKCKRFLYDDYISDDLKYNLPIDAFISDFVVYSMFSGNDFVHALPHCKVRNGGLEKLIRAYVVTYSFLNKPLVNSENKIQFDFLNMFFRRLSDSEDIAMKRSTNKRIYSKDRMTYEKEVELYEYADYSSPNNPYHTYYKNTLTLIDYSNEYSSWVAQYNAHFFEAPMDDVIREYIKSVIWTHSYYKGALESWTYYNIYRTSPTLHSLSTFFHQTHLDPVFEIDTVLSPLEQLMYVLPFQSSKLLPYALQEMMTDEDSPIQNCYPITSSLDVLSGGKNIDSAAILPKIHIPDIRHVVCNVPLNDHDIMRNTITYDVFHKTFTK